MKYIQRQVVAIRTIPCPFPPHVCVFFQKHKKLTLKIYTTPTIHTVIFYSNIIFQELLFVAYVALGGGSQSRRITHFKYVKTSSFFYTSTQLPASFSTCGEKGQVVTPPHPSPPVCGYNGNSDKTCINILIALTGLYFAKTITLCYKLFTVTCCLSDIESQQFPKRNDWRFISKLTIANSQFTSLLISEICTESKIW